MKRKRLVSTCPACGKRANMSKKLVRAKSGKIYYYVRLYHAPKNIHFFPTDSSFSSFQNVQRTARDMYSALTDYITRRMESKKVTYTSLKKEIEKSFNGAVHNEEFNRSLKKAASEGLIERTISRNKPLYSKIPEINLDEKLKFEQVVLNYDFSNKELVISAFLEPINIGQVPIKRIPYFIPYGSIDSVDILKLKVHDETDEIMTFNVLIPFSTTLETGLSITLNRSLRNGEKDLVFVKYSIPTGDRSINFLAQAPVSSLRITVIAELRYEARILRTSVNGVKEIEMSFPRHYFYNGNCIFFQVELDSLLKGENISVKLIERQGQNKRKSL